MPRTLRFAFFFTAFVAMTSLAGCSPGGPSGEPVSPTEQGSPPGAAVLELPVGQVRILETSLHDDAVRVDVAAATLGRRTVDLRGWSMDGGQGLSVTVQDSDGRMMWDMSLEGDGSIFRVTEAAGEASLIVERRWLGAGRWAETYELIENGRLRILELAYDGNDAADRARAFREFQEFWPEGTALDDNEEGLLASSIVTSPDVVSLLAADLGVPNPAQAAPEHLGGEKIPEPIERICLIADVCVLTKCAMGGPANHLCAVCASVAVACTILELICLVLGC